MSAGVPLTIFSGGYTGTEVRLDGVDGPTRVEYAGNEVGPGYFETMGIRLVRGRDFTGADRGAAARVVVINEEFARRYFKDLDAEDAGGRGEPDRRVTARSADLEDLAAGVRRDEREQEPSRIRADGERTLGVGNILITLALVLLLEAGEHGTDAIVEHGPTLPAA